MDSNRIAAQNEAATKRLRAETSTHVETCKLHCAGDPDAVRELDRINGEIRQAVSPKYICQLSRNADSIRFCHFIGMASQMQEAMSALLRGYKRSCLEEADLVYLRQVIAETESKIAERKGLHMDYDYLCVRRTRFNDEVARLMQQAQERGAALRPKPIPVPQKRGKHSRVCASERTPLQQAEA